MSLIGNTISGSTSVNTVNSLSPCFAPVLNNNIVTMNCFPMQTSPVLVSLPAPVNISPDNCPLITASSWMSNLAQWSNHTAFQRVLVNNNGFLSYQLVKVLPNQISQPTVLPPSPLMVPQKTYETASNSVFSRGNSSVSYSGDSALSRESSVSLEYNGTNSSCSTNLSRSNSCDSFCDTPAKRNIEFNLYAKGSFKVITQRGFQQLLEKLMKKHVHPSISVHKVHDPTKPNVFKKNMINGVIISCSVITDSKDFKPDLTSVNHEIETKNALYSDVSVFTEDPLDINRAASADGERVSYKNYDTDLLCNTEKISVSKFRSTEELNEFLDTVRELLYRYSESISFCKAVYTKKKNVFKTFYITLCFGEDANDHCSEIHKEFNGLGVSTYRSKSDKKTI